MNSSVLQHIGRFLILIILQVAILNNINFLGYINPQLYVLALLLYPFSGNRTTFLLVSFLLGLTIDMFCNSGGIHAAACLVLAYARPLVLRFSFGISYEYNTIRLSQVIFYERFLYISILVLIHHLVLFSLEVFNVSDILYILQKTLFTGVFTILLCLITNLLFKPSK